MGVWMVSRKCLQYSVSPVILMSFVDQINSVLHIQAIYGLIQNNFVYQEYLKEEGGLSPEAVRMIGDLLNEQSLMYTALTEMIYDQTDISDNVT